MYTSSEMSRLGLALSADSVKGNVLVIVALLGLVDAIADGLLACAARYINRRILNIICFICLAVCCLIVGFIRLFAPDQTLVSCKVW